MPSELTNRQYPWAEPFSPLHALDGTFDVDTASQFKTKNENSIYRDGRGYHDFKEEFVPKRPKQSKNPHIFFSRLPL